MKKQVSNVFPITIFEIAESTDEDILAKARVRIFHKGLNVNQSYISDEFAEKLISTIAYCPVKGIYNEDTEDFEDHGESRKEGRIYGVVPENYNFSWEKHQDDDGVEREYACVDVYLYKGLYALETDKILNSSQSMELYPPSIKGEWIRVDGFDVWKFTDASFLGLQALGEDVQPCFNGSAFYENEDEKVLFSMFVKAIKSISTKGEEKDMNKDKMVFELSDKQKSNLVGKAINKDNFKYFLVDSFDTYCIFYDMEVDELVKVDFKKNEDDSVTVLSENYEKVEVQYLSDQEKADLKRIRDTEGIYAAAETLEQEQGNKEQIEDFEKQIEEFKEKVVGLESEIESLSEYKKAIEDKEKDEAINKYVDYLDSDVIKEFTANKDNYDLTGLEKELSYAFVKENQQVFTKGVIMASGDIADSDQKPRINTILDKYN